MSAGHGVLLVDKPAGITSHTAVARVRRALGLRRVGHAGTLDPMATGLLVMGIGSGTRLLRFFVGLDKAYTTTIRLGIGTASHDADGEVTAAPGCPADVDPRAAVAALTGRIRQRPPEVSAVKVSGQPSHRRFRRGEAVDLPPREVEVKSFAITGRRSGSAAGVPVVDLDATVVVSSGTYIRALARDLAAMLGTAGHLTALRRTDVGPFPVAAAVPLEAVGPATALLTLGEAAARVLPVAVLSDDDAAAVGQGRRIPARQSAPGPTACTDGSGRLVAVASAPDGTWRYEMVVPQPAAASGAGSGRLGAS